MLGQLGPGVRLRIIVEPQKKDILNDGKASNLTPT